MAVTAGTSKAATSVRKPTPVDTVRIGSSSACTGIILGAGNDEIILDSAADSKFPYPGADHHHIIYLKSVGASCEISVSADNSSYVLLSTATALGVVQTGAITDLPFRYVKVKAITSAVTLDVQSFPALVR
tara:strand:- start:1351 stop:1743 length:393 start_codon:yes stop_codon:yes gene_type:complete